jgi:hypothetical protein
MNTTLKRGCFVLMKYFVCHSKSKYNFKIDKNVTVYATNMMFESGFQSIKV